MRTALILFLALLAPAPWREKAPPVVATGNHVMTWRGIDARTHFHADGFYACHWQGRWWHGTWECKGGELKVQESPCHDPASVTRWTVKLSSPTAGVLNGDSPWKLVPVKGRMD